MRHVLSIAGSDTSGGAGIQGDLRTIAAHGYHGLSVVSALTAQNTTEIYSIEASESVERQLQALADDIRIDAIKIGMLHSEKNVLAVADFIKNYAKPKDIPVIVDPLMVSSTGRVLLSPDAMWALTRKLFPVADLITPNIPEAERLTELNVLDEVDVLRVAELLQKRFGAAVLIKGGHRRNGSECRDTLYDGKGYTSYDQERLVSTNTHGTGCCLSTAIACWMAAGEAMPEAIRGAKKFVTEAIKHGYPIGKGEGPVDPLIHIITNSVTVNDVAHATLAAGGSPMMAEAAEEMADVASLSNALVINLGTLQENRLTGIRMALEQADMKKPVLLDPVGCASSGYRLRVAEEMLASGKISILKLNVREAMALSSGSIQGAFGVDSDLPEEIDQEELAEKLVQRYSCMNSGLTVVVTSRRDVIASGEETLNIRGGTGMQKRISGTGCMLNALIIREVIRSEDSFSGAIRAVKVMNRASLRATRRLRNKDYIATYKQYLVDEISVSRKSVYLITNESLDFQTELLPRTELALKEGVRILQYRAKDKELSEKQEEAFILRDLTERYGVTFIINDDPELARSVGADGVHLGVEDISVAEARRQVGSDMLIGATVKTKEQAERAEREGADYLGVGALFVSSTKPEAIGVGLEQLAEISRSILLPIYGIGGIKSENMNRDILEHLDGVAVVSAYYTGGLEELRRIRKRIEEA